MTTATATCKTATKAKRVKPCGREVVSSPRYPPENMHPEGAEANGKSWRGKNVFGRSTVCGIALDPRGFFERDENDDIRDMEVIIGRPVEWRLLFYDRLPWRRR